MDKPSDSVKVTIVMSRALRDSAKAKAKASETSLSAEVRRHLREWVTKPLLDLMTWTTESSEAED